MSLDGLSGGWSLSQNHKKGLVITAFRVRMSGASL
jgi:hypothetical protein